MKLALALATVALTAAFTAPPAVECTFSISYQDPASGTTQVWTIDGGNHNLPSNAFMYVTTYKVSGEGCLVLAYTEAGQTGRMETLTEGEHDRVQVHPYKSVTVLNPRPVLCSAGMHVDPTDNTKCLPCPVGTTSNKGDNHCQPMEVCSHTSCFFVRKGNSYMKCPDGTYDNLVKGLDGSYSYSNNGKSGHCSQVLSKGFMHVFHHGQETKGKHHVCKIDASAKAGGTPSCTCHCYTGKPGLGEYTHAQAEQCATTFAAESPALLETDPTACFAGLKEKLELAGCGQWFQSNQQLHTTCDAAGSVAV